MDAFSDLTFEQQQAIAQLVENLSAEFEERGISPANPTVSESLIAALTKVGLVGYDDLVNATAAIEARADASSLEETSLPGSTLFVPEEWLNPN